SRSNGRCDVGSLLIFVPCGKCTLDHAMNEAAAPKADSPMYAEKLLAAVAAVAKEARPHVEPHVTLDSALEKELGLDSLARVELVLRVENEFGVSLPEQALATS